MLTIHEHKVISRILSMLCASHFFPLDWNKSEKKLLFTKSKTKLVISYFICIWELIFVLHVGFSFFQFYFDMHYCGNGSTEQIIYQFTTFTTFLLFLTEYITLLLYGKDVCNLFNEMTRFNKIQGNPINLMSIIFFVCISRNIFMISKLF